MAKFKIKHIACCGENSVDEIEGTDFESACIDFMRECFNHGDYCTIRTDVGGSTRQFLIEKYIEPKYNITEEELG